jgi:hypothetical protein
MRPESPSRHAVSPSEGGLLRNPEGQGDTANDPCRRTSQTRRASLGPDEANGSCSIEAQMAAGSAAAGGASRWAAAMAASLGRPPGGPDGPDGPQAQLGTEVGVAAGDAVAATAAPGGGCPWPAASTEPITTKVHAPRTNPVQKPRGRMGVGGRLRGELDPGNSSGEPYSPIDVEVLVSQVSLRERQHRIAEQAPGPPPMHPSSGCATSVAPTRCDSASVG